MGFSSIKPRFGSRMRSVAPLEKQTVLSSGDWIDGSQARHFSIRDDERIAVWLAGTPLARARDWRVDHNDKLDSQVVYRRFALQVHAMGWSCFPEGRADRVPQGLFDGNRYFATQPSQRRDALVSNNVVLMESDNGGAFNANLALVMGAASLHTRGLDLDILDEELATKVYDLAVEHLGESPFVRVGLAPKAMLIYRVEGDDIALPTRSYAFVGDDGQVEKVGKGEDTKVKNAIEFLASGRNFTCYGLHHRTGENFDWSRGTLHPAIAGPQEAPVVTKKQLNAFFTAVNRVRPLANYVEGTGFSSPTGGESEVSKFQKLGGVWIPQHSRGSWLKDTEGCVVRGREAFMSSMCWAMLSANIQMLRTREGANQLLEEFQGAVVSTISSGGKWTHEKARTECASKFRSTRWKFDDSLKAFEQSGRWLAPAIPWRVLDDGSRPFAQHAPSNPRPEDGSMDWLPEQPSVFAELSGTQKVKGLIKVQQTKEQIAEAKRARALVEELSEREAIHGRVADEIDYSAEVFLATIGQPGMPPLHILKAPTGAGKTTRLIARLAAWLKANPRKPGEGPVMFLLPSHDNIREAMAVAERTGMIVPNPSDLDERAIVTALDSLGVKATIFSGKRHHCHRLDDLTVLNGAGIGTEGLCGVNVGQPDEVLCPFRARGECGYWKQQGEVITADVVFLPHSYLTMHSLPKILKEARAVIVDESIVYRLLHQCEMPLDTLTKQRGAPFVTKAEKSANPARKPKDLGEDMEQRRDHIAEVVMTAIKARKCPARAVLDRGCEDMIDDAIKVVARSHSVEREVTPNLTSHGIAEFAKRPTGLRLIEEEKFWRLLQERVDNIRNVIAKGDTDARIFLFFKTQTVMVGKIATRVDVPYVRLAWRSEMNWAHAPKLLLDASASPEIIEKCAGAEVTVHYVSAPLHVRTVAMIERPWANRAFLPPDTAERGEIDKARNTIRQARDLITKVAVSYAHGRVLVGTTIAVREVLSQGGWAVPKNVDWVHFGALRGKDGYKHHLAAISIGRSEQPIGLIDGYEAALTYDDPVPAKPYDLNGNGLDPAGGLLFRKGKTRIIPMRTGHDIGHLVPQLPNKWAQILEAQWREEELRQFLGRLRPVYRGGAPVVGVSDEVPVWLCMSSTLPPDITVDEIFTLDDMIAGAEFHDLMRLSGGVLAEGLTALLPGCRSVLGGKSLNAWTDEVLSASVPFRERLLGSMHKVRARINGIERAVRVAAWHADPTAAIAEVVHIANASRFEKLEVEILSVDLSANKRVTASLPAKGDRIDLALAELAPFGDTSILLEDREALIRDAVERIAAAGGSMDAGEIEQRWRNGQDLENIIERHAGEYERSKWVRYFDGEEIDEILPPWLQAA